MKTGFLTMAILLITIVLILFGCGQNTQAAPTTEKKQSGIQLPVVSKTVYTNLNLPAWMLTLPEGEYAIGITGDISKKQSAQVAAARDFAAGSLSSNSGSFLYDKLETLNQLEQNKDDGKPADFKIILDADGTYQANVSKQLKPLAEIKVKGNKLFLMGTGNPAINTDLVKASAGTTPKWCRVTEITEDENYYYVVGKAADARLDNAWKFAHNNALIKLAQYRIQGTSKSIKATNDATQKATMLDSVNRKFNAEFAQTWFYHKTENNVPSFNVFLQLKVKK